MLQQIIIRLIKLYERLGIHSKLCSMNNNWFSFSLSSSLHDLIFSLNSCFISLKSWNNWWSTRNYFLHHRTFFHINSLSSYFVFYFLFILHSLIFWSLRNLFSFLSLERFIPFSWMRDLLRNRYITEGNPEFDSIHTRRNFCRRTETTIICVGKLTTCVVASTETKTDQSFSMIRLQLKTFVGQTKICCFRCKFRLAWKRCNIIPETFSTRFPCFNLTVLQHSMETELFSAWKHQLLNEILFTKHRNSTGNIEKHRIVSCRSHVKRGASSIDTKHQSLNSH